MIKETNNAKENYFSKKLDSHRNFKEQAYYNFISTIPPLVVEVIVVLATYHYRFI